MELPGFLPAFLGPSGGGQQIGPGVTRVIPPTVAEIKPLIVAVDLQLVQSEADYYGQ